MKILLHPLLSRIKANSLFYLRQQVTNCFSFGLLLLTCTSSLMDETCFASNLVGATPSLYILGYELAVVSTSQTEINVPIHHCAWHR